MVTDGLLRSSFVLIVSTTLIGCGVAEGAPAKAPVPELPAGLEWPSEPPAPGKTRVVLDAPGDSSAEVIEVLEQVDVHEQAWVGNLRGWARASAEHKKPVCVAPCVVDLERGVHHLRFPGLEGEVALQVGAQPRLVRHASGSYDEGSPGVGVLATTLIWLGATAAMAGGLVYALGSVGDHDDHDQQGLKSVGLGLAIGGGAAVVLGIPLAIVSRPTRHASSTTNVPLDLSPR